MGKKKKNKNKKNREYAILVTVLCICLAVLIIALVVKNNSDKKEDVAGSSDTTTSTQNQEASSSTQTQANEQVYNSVNDIVMNKDTNEASINISNDPENVYSLKVTVELDGGEVLYESDLIAPGETLGTVTFNGELSEGEYSVIVSVDSYSSDGSELASGIIYTRTLTVE